MRGRDGELVDTLLRPDGKDLSIGAQDPAIVLHISGLDTHAQIDKNAATHFVGDDVGQDFPAVQLRVALGGEGQQRER